MHATALRDSSSCTLRVLEVILNLVELLIDIGVLKQCLRDEAAENVAAQSSSPNKSQKVPPIGSELEKSTKPMTSHRLIMNIIIRYKFGKINL